MSYNITLIPGDGIGPEVVEAAKKCIDALNLDINWQIALAGGDSLEKEGSLLPASTIESIKTNKCALKGPIITPVGSGFRSVNVAIRQKLNLFACVRPAYSIKGIKSPAEDVDIIVVRENSEDLYAGIEFNKGEKETREVVDTINRLSGSQIAQDSAVSIKPISESASLRIAEFSFALAKKENKNKVSCIHKANIMKATDGLFLRCFRQVAEKYPDIEAEDVIVDNLCMQLVKRPQKFGVLVLPNLYGDIISDLCAGLVGGLGVAPGANMGRDIAVFEPVHGAAPKYAGENKVNPTATILSGVMMLRHLGEQKAASLLERALLEVIAENKSVTYDIKTDNQSSPVGTQQMAQAIIDKIKDLS
jgi:isocitrate dehydrogenase (NAD+)